MPDTVELRIDGMAVQVRRGSTVAAAVIQAGGIAFRRSVTGEPRGPLCGMGICSSVELPSMGGRTSAVARSSVATEWK